MFSEDEKLMLDRLHSAMPGLSDEAIGIFWTAFKAQAIHRLAVERKPVDLGFVKIFPLPWRQNWKEAMMSRFKMAFSLLRSPNSGGKGQYELAAGKFYKALNEAHLLALDRSRNFICWSIDCVPSNELTRRIDQHEHARALKLDGVDYAIRFMEELPDHMHDALKVFGWYNARVAIPEAEFLGKSIMRIFQPVEFNSTQDQVNARGPSMAPVAPPDKGGDSNTCIRLPETPGDSPPAEQPGHTGAVSG